MFTTMSVRANEITDDGVSALIGASIATENAPKRAIQATLSIYSEAIRFNDQREKR